jgi:hypothetical protein
MEQNRRPIFDKGAKKNILEKRQPSLTNGAGKTGCHYLED